MTSKIFASKLFIGSNRKSEILATIINPINKELVQQIADYLDEDSKEILEIAKNPELVNPADNSADTESNTTDNEVTKTDEDLSKHIDPKPVSFHPANNHIDSDNDTDNNIDDTEPPHTDEPTDETTDVAESTRVNGEKISANTALYTNPYLTPSNPLSNIEERIIGEFGLCPETQGVTRVDIINHELWIFFDDKININPIMAPAIQLLSAKNYYYLAFNRIARSENALVFIIDFNTTNSPKYVRGEG